MGALHQAEGGGRRDAALPLRPQRRHSASEGRPEAEREGNPDHRQVGRQRFAQGNPADMPPPVTFDNPNEWAFEKEFGAPDIIVKTKPFTLPARGQDVWWRPIVPTGLDKNRCIKAVSVKPSKKGRAAAHHANTEFVEFDEKAGIYVETERVSEYALGKAGEIVPADGCRTMPANALVRWDVHYYPTGEELKNDVIEMGIWLYPENHEAQVQAGPEALLDDDERRRSRDSATRHHGRRRASTPSRRRSVSTASSRTATSAWSARRWRSSIRRRASWR